ncbi:NADH dehydrogenase subunit J [Hydrogenivirga caldilitoris]|uniref:NADH-quinone oxidoreductase subunit J n=1 Tax=Hydrogenivirga caldilitoris TaxID=246264 RepID=A0A497XR81_9AQUI|nr:NADH-quinone oxidoreductase subunit J [Hydrogenivirga caldilitoris]RLJ71495.1 NADH dehydrogenase subunit J [Hydrogenivirga caldilitoris]
MEWLIFGILAFWLLVSALGAILVRSPVHSILFFLSGVLAMAALFLSLGAELLAGLQLIIYAVAIVVFYVLVITTIPWEKVKRFEGVYRKEMLLGFPVVVLVFLLISYLVLKGSLAMPVGASTDNVRDLGKTLFTSYLFPFEVASVILLVAMIGAILLGRKEE